MHIVSTRPEGVLQSYGKLQLRNKYLFLFNFQKKKQTYANGKSVFNLSDCKPSNEIIQTALKNHCT